MHIAYKSGKTNEKKKLNAAYDHENTLSTISILRSI